jgi:hypothetical protein
MSEKFFHKLKFFLVKESKIRIVQGNGEIISLHSQFDQEIPSFNFDKEYFSVNDRVFHYEIPFYDIEFCKKGFILLDADYFYVLRKLLLIQQILESYRENTEKFLSYYQSHKFEDSFKNKIDIIFKFTNNLYSELKCIHLILALILDKQEGYLLNEEFSVYGEIITKNEIFKEITACLYEESFEEGLLRNLQILIKSKNKIEVCLKDSI